MRTKATRRNQVEMKSDISLVFNLSGEMGRDVWRDQAEANRLAEDAAENARRQADLFPDVEGRRPRPLR